MVTRNSVTRLDSKSWRLDDETGFLNVRVYPTRAGVFLYRKQDGSTVRELRPPEEVFKADSLATLNFKPFSNNHPPDNLNPQTVKEHKTGLVSGDHRKSDAIPDHTEASAVIEDPAHIEDVTKKDKVEVSCGYRCDMEHTPGTHPKYGEYDAIQRNIRYNHISSVWRGRAGAGARVTQDCARYDAEEIEPNEINKTLKNEEKTPMIKFDIDGYEVEGSDAAKARFDAYRLKVEGALSTEKTRADQAQVDLEAKKSELSTIQAKFDQAQVDLNAAQAKLDQADLETLKTSVKLAFNDIKLDGLNARQIKEKAIQAKFPSVKLDGKDEAYIEAYFEMATDRSEGKRTDSVLTAYDSSPVPEEWGNKFDLMD